MNKPNVKTQTPPLPSDDLLRRVLRENAELDGRLQAAWDENKRLRDAWKVDRETIAALNEALCKAMYSVPMPMIVQKEAPPTPAKSVSDGYLDSVVDWPTGALKDPNDAIMQDMARELIAWRERG